MFTSHHTDQLLRTARQALLQDVVAALGKVPPLRQRAYVMATVRGPCYDLQRVGPQAPRGWQ